MRARCRELCGTAAWLQWVHLGTRGVVARFNAHQPSAQPWGRCAVTSVQAVGAPSASPSPLLLLRLGRLFLQSRQYDDAESVLRRAKVSDVKGIALDVQSTLAECVLRNPRSNASSLRFVSQLLTTIVDQCTSTAPRRCSGRCCRGVIGRAVD